jgi:metal transporter CNNM
VSGRCGGLELPLRPFPAPIAYPIARLLDRLLGIDHGNTYKKAELRSFLQFHRTNSEEPLRDDEISILNAVLELNTKSIESIMTPMKVRSLVSHRAFSQFISECGLLECR